MASDNITLNAGSGGAVMRTLSDGTNEWIPAVLCYATSTTAGAAAFQFVGASNGVPVTPQGTFAVTASAGTNLNTSALALESGGHLNSLDTKTPALGQALAAASTPVVLTAAQLTTLTPLTTVAVTGTFWQTTQPVSAASLPLPTGAAADTSVNGILLAQASTTSGQHGPLVQGACTTAAPTYTTAQTAPLSLDTTGNLRVAVLNTVSMAQSGAWTVEMKDGSGNSLTSLAVGSVHALTTALVDASGNQVGANGVLPASASHETSTIYSGTTALTPQFVSFTLSSSGATQIVALTAGKKIRVLRYSVEFNSTVNFNLQSHTTTATATGTKYGIANKTSGGAYCPVGIFQTVAGEALDGNLSAGGTVSGELTYILV